jgi:hypothetical protein
MICKDFHYIASPPSENLSAMIAALVIATTYTSYELATWTVAGVEHRLVSI